MKRSNDRILTTHVGSLVRPESLRTLKEDSPGYDTLLRESTVDVVKKQAAAGIDIISDGEYGKSQWSAYIMNRITGFEIRPDQLRPLYWLGRDLDRFRDFIAKDDGDQPQTSENSVRALKIST